MTGQQTDPAIAAIDQIKHKHWQHVCENHPEPGICVTRCPGRWPCAPYRAALAVEAVRGLHRRCGPATRGEHKGRDYCPACSRSVDDFTAYELWPCFEHLAVLAALTGTTVVAITARELAEQQASGCAGCSMEALRPGRCSVKAELDARWRCALREADQQQ